MLRGQTEQGEEVRVIMHPLLSWVLGIAAVLVAATIIGTARTLQDLTTRVAIIEANRFTAQEAVRLQETSTAQLMAMSESFVGVREYSAAMSDIRTQLTEIRRLLEAAR